MDASQWQIHKKFRLLEIKTDSTSRLQAGLTPDFSVKTKPRTSVKFGNKKHSMTKGCWVSVRVSYLHHLQTRTCRLDVSSAKLKAGNFSERPANQASKNMDCCCWKEDRRWLLPSTKGVLEIYSKKTERIKSVSFVTNSFPRCAWSWPSFCFRFVTILAALCRPSEVQRSFWPVSSVKSEATVAVELRWNVCLHSWRNVAIKVEDVTFGSRQSQR